MSLLSTVTDRASLSFLGKDYNDYIVHWFKTIDEFIEECESSNLTNTVEALKVIREDQKKRIESMYQRDKKDREGLTRLFDRFPMMLTQEQWLKLSLQYEERVSKQIEIV